ncbi:peptidylprolyl isomerase [Streptacidiphilus pinicola]|uniref:Peptidyl-prolyl cis-trans isomerase n=2 Tax=Streptacidiphilus pinicola TaxID=2219663 RepID=A0A2X0J5B6_9ACTN|nr:peptidylprolyl isomerase [Streptacidiphilus pinicola]
MEALRAQEKAKARQRRTLGIGAAVLVVLLAVGGILWATLGSSKSSSSTAGGAFCGNVASGSPSNKQWPQPPAMSIDTKATYTATLKTSCGDVGLKLDATHAPKTVNNFVFLAQQGFFDHSHCHRLTTAGIYVLQCGDPTATGTGSPGYKFDDEYLNDPAIQGGTYPAGTLAMANSGPNTNGSQFFLVYKDSQLSANYTPFGTITSGLDILNHIARDGSDNSNGQGDGKPNDNVVINSVAVAK